MNIKNPTGIVILSFLLICFFMSVPSIYASEWNGIIPLKSSRENVETLLGKPDENGGYKIGSQYVFIYYSSSDCTDLKGCECLVNENTVTRIRVYIHNEVKLDSLNISLKEYNKKVDNHLLVYTTYSNFKEGIVYTVYNKDNTVVNINYFPSKEDCKKLEKNAK